MHVPNQTNIDLLSRLVDFFSSLNDVILLK